MSSLWKRYKKGLPCPICGKDSACSQHAEGWVKCMRAGPGAIAVVPGWEYERAITKAGLDGSVAFKWVPPGGVREVTPFQKAEAEKEDQQYAVWTVEEATRNWHRAGQGDREGKGANHPRLKKYLGEARCLPLERLPLGQLPKCLRFAPRCLHSGSRAKGTRVEWPAMVAAYEHGIPELKNLQNETKQRYVAIHRTFLSRATADKIGKEEGPGGDARMTLGRELIPDFSSPIVLSDNYRSGVLIVGEGIETTMGGWLTRADHAAAWAMRDRGHLMNMPLRDELFTWGGERSIHTVVILEDLDRSRDGQKACMVLEDRIRKRAPHVSVVLAKIRPEDWPTLAEKDADGDVWPAGDAKSSDWNDPYKIATPEEVEAALWRGVNLDANAARAARIASEPPVVEVGVTEGESGQDGCEAGGDARPTEAGGGGSGSGPPGEPPKGGAESAAGGDGDRPRAKRPVIPEDRLDQAERYLSMVEMGEGASAFPQVTYWQDRWYEYTGRHWVEMSPSKLFGRVQRWLRGCWTRHRGEVVPASTLPEDVGHVTKSLAGLVFNDCEQMPAWMDLGVREGGSVDLASAVRRRGSAGMDQKRQLVAYANGLVDLRELAEGRYTVHPHCPQWFSASVRDFAVPAGDEIAAAWAAHHDGDSTLIGEIIEAKCPKWLAFLREITDEDDAWIDSLGEFFGQSLSGRRLVHKVPLIIGPQRAGKGTIDKVWQMVVGERNVVATSFRAMTRQFHWSAWVGKNLAVMSDAKVSHMIDSTEAVDKIKMVSGDDAVEVEWKNDKVIRSMRLPATLVIYSNDTPNLRDESTALAHRFVFLPLTKTYLGREDMGLIERLSEELEGITLWALAGYKRLLGRVRVKAGVTEPAVSEDQREGFKRLSSPVRAFVEDHVQVTESDADVVWQPDAFAAWQRWCENGGNAPGSLERFAAAIYGMFPQCRVPKGSGDGSQTGRVRLIRANADGVRLSRNVRVFRRMKLVDLPPGVRRPEWTGESVSEKAQQQWLKPEQDDDDPPPF